jgi:methylated-DNA-protein-cysteine methyltransferase related protein
MAHPPFFREVHRLVRRIPRGKVATYGQIAEILGRPRAVRAVGTALRRLEGPLARVVPWHRVVNSAGRISRRDRDWMELQRELLEREGVRFTGRGAVDLRLARWARHRRARYGPAKAGHSSR